MILMNDKMVEKIKSIDLARLVALPEILLKIIGQGFCRKNDCIFLFYFSRKMTNASEHDFEDKTGYECFINSIHIDDYTSTDYFSCAYAFAMLVFQQWGGEGNNGTMRAIISCDELGASVRFHLVRDGESWTGEDLESFDDAIFIMDSDG